MFFFQVNDLFGILILHENGEFGCNLYFLFFFCNLNFACKWQLHVLQFVVLRKWRIWLCCSSICLHFFFLLQFKLGVEMAILAVICMFCCVCFVKGMFFLQFGCCDDMATLVVLFNLPVLLCHQSGLVETPKARRG